MKPGDRIRLFKGCHARIADQPDSIVSLPMHALGVLHTMSPAGWSGTALLELDQDHSAAVLRRYLVPWEALELAPGCVSSVG